MRELLPYEVPCSKEGMWLIIEDVIMWLLLIGG
jgi:hypothetical protein